VSLLPPKPFGGLASPDLKHQQQPGVKLSETGRPKRLAGVKRLLRLLGLLLAISGAEGPVAPGRAKPLSWAPSVSCGAASLMGFGWPCEYASPPESMGFPTALFRTAP